MARTKKQKNHSESMRVETIEEWLAAGNKITVCPPGARTEDLEPMGSPRGYGKKRKAAAKSKD
jgi:hypothetical protein